MTTGTFTEQDTQTFATKLEAFSQTLTTGEQAILTLIEQHLTGLTTTTTDDDVQGYMVDVGAVANIRQREMLYETGTHRTGTDGVPATGGRAGLWQRIAVALGTQATAMAPRATGPVTN